MSIARNIRKKHRQLQVVRRHPQDMLEHFGCKWFSENTGTLDIAKAEKIRDRLFYELDQRYEAIRAGLKLDESQLSIDYLNTPDSLDKDGWQLALITTAEDMEEKEPGSGVQWYRRVTGAAVPLDQHLERHLREATISPATKDARRAAVKRLAEYMSKSKLEVALQRVDRKVAGDFATAMLDTGISPVTVNGYLSNLSSYFQFLHRKGLVKYSNPFKSQQLPVKGAKQEREAWTTEEVRLLIENAPTKLLKHVCAFAALSGLRANELAELRVKDCVGSFWVHEANAKTSASVRQVPIHHQLSYLISDRVEGKLPDDYIFHELNSVKAGNRGKALVKRFSIYREKMFGKPTDRKQAAKCFHSFRHSFVTERLKAGCDFRMVQLTVGHIPVGGVTNVYGGKPTEAQLREVVEACSLKDV